MKVDYGLRVLMHLAQTPTPVPISASEIADRQKIPEAYLHHVLSDLQAGGMLESRRGPSGGHMLARPAKEITVADVCITFDRKTGHAIMRGRYFQTVGHDVTRPGVNRIGKASRQVEQALRIGNQTGF